MTKPNQRRVLPTSPSTGWWWTRLLVGLLFVVHVPYVQIHLLAEAHDFGPGSRAAHVTVPHDEHADGESHHHQPHAAADHQLHRPAKQHTFVLTIDLVVTESSVIVTLPESQLVDSFVKHGSPPGESPPAPLQPRAPPIV